jgi:hypothetical protein
MPSKWLDWTPESDEITEKSRTADTSKPSEPGFDGFEGQPSRLFPIIQCHEESSRYLANAMEKAGAPKPSKPSEPPIHPALPSLLAVNEVPGAQVPLACPAMPRGVRLVRWEPKAPPVAIDVCSVVVDISKFIEGELRALDSRLNNPWTIHGGFTVLQMLDRLAQAGVEVELEPRGGASTTKSQDTEGGGEIK